MPYVVEEDGVTVLKSLGKSVSRLPGQQSQEFYNHVATVYDKGDVLSDDDVSPVQEGDSRLRKISQEEADELGGTNVGIDLAATYQSEGGGPLDEPRKVQRGITGQDLEIDAYKEVVDASGSNEAEADSGSKSKGSSKKS